MRDKNPFKTVTLELPDKILTLLRRPPDEIVQVLRVAAALHFYERGILSQDKAAEIAGLELEDFISELERMVQQDSA